MVALTDVWRVVWKVVDVDVDEWALLGKMLVIFEIPLEAMETQQDTVLVMFSLTFETPVEILVTPWDTLEANVSIIAYGMDGIIEAHEGNLPLPLLFVL